MVTKRSNILKPAAFSYRFVYVSVTFLLPPGIKGLNEKFDPKTNRVRVLGE